MVATSQIAQTTLRSVLGQHVLDELLSEREKINAILQGIIDESTAPWGIKVSIVEVKDVEIPSAMQRAMARQAEAERERRAKIINAEGEFQAAERLKDAARGDRRATRRVCSFATCRRCSSSARRRRRRSCSPVDLISAVPGEEGRRARPERRASPRSRLRPHRRDRARPGEAPGRSARHLDPPSPEELASCPFCAGHEQMTPPQTLVLPEQGDWQVRVVPNLYPALERQEVVVHSRRHIRSIAEAEDGELELVAEAWQRRAAAEPGHVFALLNEGRGAGASLAHSHSQLAWLSEPPRPTARLRAR